MKKTLSIAILLSGLLAACGGGGGGSTPPPVNPPATGLAPPAFSNLTGTAPADAALGQPFDVQWTLPAGVTLQSVALDAELTAGELRSRGYYLGSNVSYNLKKLVETGYIFQERSRSDRRSVRIKLTPKGEEVAEVIDELYDRHLKPIDKVGGLGDDEFDGLNKALARLERFWVDQILYKL